MSFEPTEISSDLSLKAKADFLHRQPNGFYIHGIKRVLDVLLVLLAAPIVVPVVLFIALLIMRDGQAPFYWSNRVGRNGRIFRMMKLRTMVHDADSCLAAYLASDPTAAAEWTETQKLKTDPRTTAFGRMLRKTSLD